ncbi:MAG TPA: hypothetical protein VLF66_19180 [Thermoanaerobaculia bacterium]|nr:hypothetical protein [Thermoanaerobaculia bacterium]
MVVTYTDRMGETYYLHEGRTKTGKVRYFVAKTIREGALSAMPDGYEITESINGVVSVRRVDPSALKVPEADLVLARAELGRHAHLRRHRIEALGGELVVFEPRGGASLTEMSDSFFPWGLRVPGDRPGDPPRRVRYDPVMKLVLTPQRGIYNLHRMTYRGDGGWSWPLGSGPLEKLLERYLGLVGTDELFELY